MPVTRRRSVTKLLRLHPDELARITARAEACGSNPARFIRETALGATPKARHHAETDQLLRCLARLGGALSEPRGSRGPAAAVRTPSTLPPPSKHSTPS
jgi:hypothetical protein